MLRVLMEIGVELTRYHGGSLAGVDIKRVIANAPFVFSKFATILKDEKRKNPNCTLTDKDIDILCNRYKELYLLWDGAFATARTINPTEDDLALYCRFANAAVHCHKKIGCSITHKVHLMWLNSQVDWVKRWRIGWSYSINPGAESGAVSGRPEIGRCVLLLGHGLRIVVQMPTRFGNKKA